MKDHKLLLHSLLSIIARFVGVGLNFSVRILITRTLAMSEAGVLFLLMTFIPGVALLSRIGLEQLLVKEVASADDSSLAFRSSFLKNSYKLTLISSLLVTILWLLAAPFMREWFFHNQISLHHLMWAGGGLFFSSLVIINTFYLKAIKRTVSSVLVERALPALTFLVLLGLFWNGFTQNQQYIQLYTLSLVAAGTLSLVLTLPYTTKNKNHHQQVNVPTIKAMARR